MMYLFAAVALFAAKSCFAVVHCSDSVSTSIDTRNVECHQLCNDRNAEEFLAKCSQETTQCFDNYVFGYSPKSASGLEGRNIPDITSAVACQSICQDAGDCARFSWDPVSLVCNLKSLEMTTEALGVMFKEPRKGAPPVALDSRWQWCSLDKQNHCFNGDLECLKCADSFRCAWKNDEIVSGPNYCSADEDLNTCVLELPPLSEGGEDDVKTIMTWSSPRKDASVVVDFREEEAKLVGHANYPINCGAPPCQQPAFMPVPVMTPIYGIPVMLPSYDCSSSSCPCKPGSDDKTPPCLRKFLDDHYPHVQEPYADPLKLCSESFVFEILFLQDISKSFENDLENVRRLIPEMMDSISTYFPGSKFGLASFADKPIAPLGYASSLDSCYRLHTTLTRDIDSVKKALDELFITSGNDWKEAQMEAMMHAALSAQPGFSYPTHDYQGRKILRVIVLSTDSSFHLAGDGTKLGLRPNDGDANLSCTEEDYPALIQVEDALVSRDIIPMFLTSPDVYPIYEALLARFNDRGIFGVVGTVSADSSDIIQGIFNGIDQVCRQQQQN